MLHTVGQEQSRNRGEEGTDEQHHSCPGPVVLQPAKHPRPGIIHSYMRCHDKQKQREGPDQHAADQKFGADRHKNMALQ
ncbi:hypothetical protein D3C73_684220 [compost metagenome]